MPHKGKSSHEGIETRHARSCPARSGGTCGCRPTHQASVWSAREKKRIRKTFATVSEAKRWRNEAITALARGTMKAPTKKTLSQAAEEFLTGIEAGTIRSRSGDPYKPSARRAYEQALRLRVLPELGGYRLSEVRRTDVQDFADRMQAQDHSPSTIRNTLLPLRKIFNRALNRGEVAVNPMQGLELQAVRGKRDRIASPQEAAQLLAALPEEDQALWATALYTGLRQGELRALDWSHIDLANARIQVERSLDAKGTFVDPKSRAGKRSVPIPKVLRQHLLAHRLRSGRSEGLVFQNTKGKPFNPGTAIDRARRAWKAADLQPIGMHECRHTFASLMIAADVNAKSLSTFMGHANISITMDRYGHLMPGSEEQAAALMDAYLEQAVGS